MDLKVNLLWGRLRALGREKKDCPHTSSEPFSAGEELREGGECRAGRASLSLFSSVQSLSRV